MKFFKLTFCLRLLVFGLVTMKRESVQRVIAQDNERNWRVLKYVQFNTLYYKDDAVQFFIFRPVKCEGNLRVYEARATDERNRAIFLVPFSHLITRALSRPNAVSRAIDCLC